jgi:hypothetical protein
MHCVHDDTSGHEVRYGEELHASPAKRVKEIAIQTQDARVAKSLFQVLGNSFGVQSANQSGGAERDRHSGQSQKGGE